MEVRRAAVADEALLAQLRLDAIRVLALSAMSAEDAEAWATGVAPDRIVRAIVEHQVWVYVDEVIIGWVEVDQDHIAALYVSPLRAGRGVGTTLLAHAEAAILGAGFSVAHLEASPNALGFYLRRGYGWNGIKNHHGAYPLHKRLRV